MKNIFRNFAILSLVASALATTSCEDMMTVETGDKAYVNAQDTLYSYLGIMRAMQDVAERQVILGEIRGDLVTPNELYTTDTLKAIANFDNSQTYLEDRSENSNKSCSMLQISDYYNIINNCNFYIYNCDTSAVKSSVKYMQPEYAQVKAIRAWAYLQLVKNYKEVPYITQPVNNLNVIKNFDYSGNLVNKDNLIDKMIDDGLYDLRNLYPQYGDSKNKYGKWSNGYTDISARLCFIPIRLVLADMYLLRGASANDYYNAATLYYDYLHIEESVPFTYASYCLMSTAQSGKNSYGSSSWGPWAATYSYDEDNEVISLIPGSANAGLGKMLTRVADIYGYITTSSQSSGKSTSTDDEGTTSTNTDANGNEVYETSGNISVAKTYKRQFGPSEAYNDVVNAQTYVICRNPSENPPTFTYIQNSDARYGASVEEYSATVGDNTVADAFPLCSKAARGSAFYYTIPIYRKTLVWLRLAEAINRMGYPEFAFAILKDGINQHTLPTIVDRYPEKYDEAGRLMYYKDGTYYSHDAETDIYYKYNEEEDVWEEIEKLPSRTVVARDTIYRDSISYGDYGAMYYVTDSTRLNAFNSLLPFTDNTWNKTYGVHAKGTGISRITSSSSRTYFYEYKKTSGSGEEIDGIITNITGYNDSVYYDFYKLIEAQGVDLDNATEADVVNAVENLIVDELALETAFEGNRFTDLVRIAEHKNAAGYDGTEWLARKIANRGTRAATSTSEAIDGFDTSLYTKLKSPSAWYFSLPKWADK